MYKNRFRPKMNDAYYYAKTISRIKKMNLEKSFALPPEEGIGVFVCLRF